MKTKQQLSNRKYYLRRRMKHIYKLRLNTRIIYIGFSVMWGGGKPDKRQQQLEELRDVYGYSIQLEIE